MRGSETGGWPTSCLIALHDNATSGFMHGRFEPRRAIVKWLERHGRPQAVYVDHAGTSGSAPARRTKRTRTIIGTALEKLGVEMILVNSPQVQGRVERTFGTAADRLIKGMRLARITTLEEANGDRLGWPRRPLASKPWCGVLGSAQACLGRTPGTLRQPSAPRRTHCPHHQRGHFYLANYRTFLLWLDWLDISLFDSEGLDG